MEKAAWISALDLTGSGIFIPIGQKVLDLRVPLRLILNVFATFFVHVDSIRPQFNLRDLMLILLGSRLKRHGHRRLQLFGALQRR